LKLVHYDIEKEFDFDENCVYSLIIENQDFFREVITELSVGNNENGNIVLSDDNEVLSISSFLDVIKDFAPFDIYSKSLSSKLISYFERSINENFFIESQTLLSEIEKFINSVSFNFPFDVGCTKLNNTALLKAVGLEIIDSYSDSLLKLLNYFEIVRELSGDKIFVLINMRSYYPDDRMQLFIDSACDSAIKLLLIESTERSLLSGENRCIIDSDLCEI